MRLKVQNHRSSRLGQTGQGVYNWLNRNVLIPSCEIKSPTDRNEKTGTRPNSDSDQAVSHDCRLAGLWPTFTLWIKFGSFFVCVSPSICLWMQHNSGISICI